MGISYNPIPKRDHKKILYHILPTIYRQRDTSKDLEKFLNGAGVLLDQFHKTLLQRYADIFPDDDDSFELVSQKWLLPYIADLLDVHMVSPLEQGQRDEIAKAISWRKAKGTLKVVEEIAESVGGLETVVHEGWKRVATTARIGMPVLPAAGYGYTGNASFQDDFNSFQQTRKPDLAPMWARHPALAPGTVDLRCRASAVAAEEDNPAARISRVSGKTYRWRQSCLHGAPNCNEGHSLLPVDTRQADWIPGYFDDPSVRTVDFRNPGWRRGHFHPRRVLIFTATHPGFFPDVPAERTFDWEEGLAENEQFLSIATVEKNGNTTVFRNMSLTGKQFEPIVINERVMLGQVPDGTGPVEPEEWQFDGFIFTNTIEVDSGRLTLNQCAVKNAEVHSIDLEQSVLTVNDCLLKGVQAARGLASLQYSTILTTTIAQKLNASDCIFNGQIRKHHDPASLPGKGCVRYSSLIPEQDPGELTVYRCPFVSAVFFTTEYKTPGCGVLHPATQESIRSGAQDGGEMGACHHLYLATGEDAVITKLKSYLPTGMTAVAIPDGSLHDLPGEVE
ncbi:phage tail protein [Desulfobacter curvatus]|uniref:phage tail protein n=1 Tax=Desulfobacter curvatus TaxID=2290 RepID=UPI0003611A5D|nr:phage tail protein [Desulfobacter curvatus]